MGARVHRMREEVRVIQQVRRPALDTRAAIEGGSDCSWMGHATDGLNYISLCRPLVAGTCKS